MAAPVTHFEVNVKDGKRAQEFYTNLFGWKVNANNPINYALVDTGVKMGINGGIGQNQADQQPSVTFYVQVEDIQAHLDKAVSLGGKVVLPYTDIPNMVTFAQFSDPEGNVVGLVKGPQSPPKETKAKKAVAGKKKRTTRASKGRKRGRR